MKIFDTLSKEKRDFIPIDISNIGFYHCGPTVYWTQHIGNMRSVVLADVIHRSLIYAGYKVTFVRNYTDVGHLTSDGDHGEDKMEKGAKRENKTPAEIAQKYIDIYEQDVALLHVIPPTHTVWATKHIQEMIDMVEVLLKKGFAYQTDLAIYFDISKKLDYTKLSGQKLDELLSGTGHGDVVDSEKKNPGDFALWFFKTGKHEHALQTWENSFSKTEGFPGWHIECSAMSKKYLGETFDIHMGGIEHIPIHHTNEIAQSESASGKSFVNYWIHNEHLLVNDHKMSKSEGTSYVLQDILDKDFSALDLRYFFLQAHYRSKQNFTWDALEASKQARHSLSSKIASYEDGGDINTEFKKLFQNAIESDFAIPEALSVLFAMLSSNISDTDKRATALDFDLVLGLGFDTYVNERVRALVQNELPQNIQELLTQRIDARARKNWPLSDSIRDTLADEGYEIKDSELGQELYKK